MCNTLLYIIIYRKTPCLDIGDSKDKLGLSRRKGAPGERPHMGKGGRNFVGSENRKKLEAQRCS